MKEQTESRTNQKSRRKPSWPKLLTRPLPSGNTQWRIDVVVDGNIVATEKLNNNRPGEFYDAAYALPAELVRGKDKVTVKFSAHPGNIAGGLYGCRVLRTQPNLK